MYVPNAFREDDHATLVAFMQANSFATLVSVIDGVPFASHLPLVVSTNGTDVILTGHVAKANPHWQAFGSGETLAIFGGPHAYVSPRWYEKRDAVPTWNYIAVHAYGTPRTITFAEAAPAMEHMLERLIDQHEPAYGEQWNSLPEKFRAGMMQGIVAFDMPITRLEGKAKLSQNRSQTDQHAVAAALQTSERAEERATGAAMFARRAGENKETNR